MKKYLYFIVLVFLIYLNMPTIKASSYTKEEVIYHNIEKPLQVWSTNEGYLLQYDTYFLYKKSNKEIRIDGLLKCFDSNENDLVIVSSYQNELNLYKISKDTVKSVKLNSGLEIKKVRLNDRIILFGIKNNFSIILEFSMELELLNEHKFFENAKILFNDVVLYNDKWYIFGLKYGHSDNKEVYNVGNYNDTKNILFILDINYELKEIKYFNHNSKNEHANFLKVDNNNIYYQFRTDEDLYIYKSDCLFQKNQLLIKTELKWDQVLIGENNEYLLFDDENSLIMQTPVETIDFGTYNYIYDYTIKNGRLECIYYNRVSLFKVKIEEYHIDKLDPITLSYNDGNVDFKTDLNDLDEIEIRSYFTKVQVFCNTDFIKSIPGNYNVELLLARKYHDNVKLSSQVVVEPYVNVVNGGVYCTGFSLKFLGVAALNGQKINNGHNILESGEYTLEISDNLENIQVFNFIIVDDYYKRSNEYIKYDIIGTTNKETEIKLYFDNIEVEEVIVNDQNTEFVKDIDGIILKLPQSTKYGIEKYVINKIITQNCDYQINKLINVNYLKNSPEINIIENNNEMPNLSIMIDDPDQTLQYVEFKLTNSNYTNSVYYYLTQNFTIDDLSFNEGQIEVYIAYDLGDGIIRKESIGLIDGKYKHLNNFINVNTTIEGEIVKEINLQLNMKEASKVNKLQVCEIDIVNNYKTEKNYTNLLISLVLTVVIVIGVVIYTIIKKRKNKQYN